MKAAARRSVSNDTEKTSHSGLNVEPILKRRTLSAFPTRHPLVQPKLQIGSPNDKFEQEADRVAEQVMKIPEPGSKSVQRKPTCPECLDKEEEEEELIQTKQSFNQAPDITPALQSQIQSMKGSGQPLPQSTLSFFEPRFGHDFSKVKVHTDPVAAEMAKSINARAFTIGKNVVFGAGQYSPGTSSGKSLLAHELTHVQQQTVSRQVRADRFAACGTTENCPPRDRGEVDASRTDPMDVLGVTDPDGILVSNFEVGSAAIKPGLATNSDFTGVHAAMRANPGFRWEILGFTDCDGSETINTSLRTERANALLRALPEDVRSQITGTRGAPIDDCMQNNTTAEERRLNRSAFMRRTVTSYAFPEETVEAALPPPTHLYGVTSPASQYFVRASPNGEIIGQLVLSEMRVQVIGEAGTNIEDLWLQVRFQASDMETIQAAYASSMATQVARLPGLQTRRDELRAQIHQLQSRPGLSFEVQAPINRVRQALAPIESEIQQIEAHQRRLVTPYTGRTAWVGAAALGVVAMHYDSFLDLVDAFDAAHSHEPLRDRLTRLRQFGEDASLEGDTVVGRGGNLPNRVTQSSRSNTSNWQLLFEAKQIRMPDGSFIDIHHFILGLDALALPRDDQSSNRVLRSWGIASVSVGESWSATTWSGDVGGAVGDYVLHRSSAWEAQNTTEDNSRRLRFYFETRAPDMDLLADIDAWGSFSAIPRTNTSQTSLTSLRQIFESTYGPAGQTAQEYNTQITPQRRRGVENFLCNYGFTSPRALVSQTEARTRVLEQVRIFATGWYDTRAGGGQPVFGRTGSTDRRIQTASSQMTDMFLRWLQDLASTVGLTSLTCGNLSSPLQRRDQE